MTRKRNGTHVLAGAALVLAGTCAAGRAETLTIDRSDYADKLRGMWFGEVLANWTGRMTEGSRRGSPAKPFYTDADWGAASDTSPFVGQPIGFNFQNPWLTDDDTDVEYSYVSRMVQAGSPLLTTQQLNQAWTQDHTQWLFYANATARSLMQRGASSESASLPAANIYSHYIDAQLTTEVFGALAPGRPDAGMRYGLAPTLVTSRGHATHAAQYFQNLYSLAAAVPTGLSPAQKMRWLNGEARKFVPDTSKVADIIDFVTADFQANPDVNNWEATRDKIYQRYQANAAANGFHYRDWTESSVNVANGVMALLYGNGDYRRTVQIATLSGWDSDNATASLGGLFGLTLGYQAIVDRFTSADYVDRFSMSNVTLSDDFNVRFSGLSNMADHVPAKSNVEDTFTMLAARMIPLVDVAVAEMGGTVDLANDTWTIETRPASLAQSPTERLMRASGNNAVRALGGTVLATSSAVGQSAGDAARLQLVADGFEYDFSGRDYDPSSKDGLAYTTLAPANTAGTEQWLAVNYSLPVLAEGVRFIEGDNVGAGGGAFGDIRLELFVEGQWLAAPAGTTLDETLDPNSPFQILEFRLPYAMSFSGMRVLGHSGAGNFAVSAAELDAILVPESGLLTAAVIPLALTVRRRRRG